MNFEELANDAGYDAAQMIKGMPLNKWYHTIGKFRAVCSRLEELGFLERGENYKGMGFPKWRKIKELDT